MATSKKYWLVKSEPTVYSIDDFTKDQTTRWEGVRNYQARNFMTNEMSVGDSVLFYHSNATPPSVVGLGKVSKPAAPDTTALNKKSEYFDPKATPEKPIWFCVELEFITKFSKPVSMDQLRASQELQKMQLLQRGSRLSVMPVTKEEFDVIVGLGR